MTDEPTLEVVDENGRLDVVESETVTAAAEKKKRRRHRQVSLRRRTLAFLGAATIAGIGYFVWLQYQNHQLIAQTHTLTQQLIASGNRHHAETNNQNAVIAQGEKVIEQGEKLLITDHTQTESQITEIQTLQEQVATLVPIIDGLPPADQYLAQLAKAFITDVNDLCAGTGQCVPIAIPQP